MPVRHEAAAPPFTPYTPVDVRMSAELSELDIVIGTLNGHFDANLNLGPELTGSLSGKIDVIFRPSQWYYPNVKLTKVAATVEGSAENGPCCVAKIAAHGKPAFFLWRIIVSSGSVHGEASDSTRTCRELGWSGVVDLFRKAWGKADFKIYWALGLFSTSHSSARVGGRK